MQDHALNREKGDRAEAIVKEYLVDNSFKIKKSNFHFGKLGEIDIIAERNGILHFIEVRSRYSRDTIDPIHTLNPKKRSSLRKSAEGYLYVNKIEGIDCQFDFIKVDMFENPPMIHHLENAF
jgi:putative endonuclease